MNFIRELVLEKIVPLGFSYNEIMLVVQRKIKKKKVENKTGCLSIFCFFFESK